VYRVHLFTVDGFTLWDSNWYGGHYLPDYSLLFPALAALIGLHWTGVLAACASTLLFRALVREHFMKRTSLACSVFALSASGDLFIGRITFALGVTCGLASVLAAMRGWRAIAVLGSLACAAASPVAAAFLVLAAGADLSANRKPGRAAVLAIPAVGVTLALAVLFPEGGYEPFALTSLLAAAGASLALILVLPARERLLRHGAQLYLLALLLSYVVPSPMGSNAVRFGVLFIPATLAGTVELEDVQRLLSVCSRGCQLLTQRTLPVGRATALWLAGALSVALLVWQVDGPLAQSLTAAGEPSSRYSFYVPVIRFLDAHRDGTPMRIEVPFSSSHWDATILGERFDLARGWERQLDTRYDALFYAPRLSAHAYYAWLLETGVRYVALSDAPMDFSSVQEAALIRRGVPFLHEVFASENWRVYAVAGARPLASGPGQMTALDGDRFTIRCERPGRFLVRVRYTPYWKVTAGSASIGESQGGWTELHSDRAGTITVDAQFSLSL
jgi:hypothetical protein